MTNAKNNSGVAIETCTVATCEPGEHCTVLGTLVFLFLSAMPTPKQDEHRHARPCLLLCPALLACHSIFCCAKGQDGRSLFNRSSVYPILFLAAPSNIVSESLVCYVVCWQPPASFLMSGETLGSARRERGEWIPFLLLQCLACPFSMHCWVFLAFCL